MPNALDATRSRKIFQVYGPTGSGKTQAFLSIPGKKFSYAFDPSSIETLIGYDIEYASFDFAMDISIGRTQKGARDPNAPTGKGREPNLYMDFQNHIENWLNGKPDEEGRLMSDFDVIGFNSLTTLSYATLTRVLWINNKMGQIPELSDYMITGDTLLRMLATVIGTFKGIVFVEQHDDLVQDQLTKKVHYKLDAYKNLRRELPRLVTDLIVTQSDVIDGKGIYSIKTTPSREHPQCKNSMHLSPVEDMTMDLSKSLDGQGFGQWMK